MNRRQFVASLSALPSAAGQTAQSARLPIKKALVFNMLPSKLSILERFEMAKRAGFEQVECHTEPNMERAAEFKAAAERSGLPIHSVMNSAHWEYPLSSADPQVVAKSIDGVKTSLQNAKLWGADTVLVVPAVVNPQTRYQDAWTRSQAAIRQLIPIAQELGVTIAIEEVWNKFLLSPMEFARYVDEFNSPWVKAYFDVGNVVLYGFPQDWIRTLGKRIVKLHFKDFSFRPDPVTKKRVAEFVNLGDGDIDWQEIHRSLVEIGFTGTASVELASGDEPYLADVVKRFDKLLARGTSR
ncbi:MAG TPA: sugar phosphate isomerase/epimerase family protein [Bryobacteraceae bacterium]|nr:sugar phosphate isomerase/epimerase family protein [Bryobacteraceae bacterium]